MLTNKHIEGDNDSLAFNYVIGTLLGQERIQFIKRLTSDTSLEHDVLFWEEQLISYNHSTQVLVPLASTWVAIEQKLNINTTSVQQGSLITRFNPLQWLLPSALTFILCIAIGLIQFSLKTETLDSTLNTEYVAVLTNTKGEVLLTVLTPAGGKNAYLQWGGEQKLNTDKSMQIWAISRRDSEARSLMVVESTHKGMIPIDEALWRMIKDSEYLLLTEEEQGGSALGEPSEDILAKGVCVRIDPNKKPS